MANIDRSNIAALIERTNDEGTRTLLMIIMALFDELAEHREDFQRHEIAEMAVVKQLVGDPLEHQQQHLYIQGAIAAQVEKAALRKAIIEKSLAGLVWAGIVFAGGAIWTAMNTHGVGK